MAANIVTISCTLIAWFIVSYRCRRGTFTENGLYWVLLGALTGITAAHAALPWVHEQNGDLFGFIVMATGSMSMCVASYLLRQQSGNWSDENWNTVLVFMSSMGCSLVVMLVSTSQLLTPTEISVLATLIVNFSTVAVAHRQSKKVC